MTSGDSDDTLSKVAIVATRVVVVVGGLGAVIVQGKR